MEKERGINILRQEDEKQCDIHVVGIELPCKHHFVPTGLKGELYCFKCDELR